MSEETPAHEPPFTLRAVPFTLSLSKRAVPFTLSLSKRALASLVPCLLSGLLLGATPAYAVEDGDEGPGFDRAQPERESGTDATGAHREEDRMHAERCVPPSWVNRLWPDRDAVKFQPTTLEERAAFAQLVPALLAAAPHTSAIPRELIPLAAAVGFELELWESGSHRIWVLRESDGRHRGAGAYLFRTGPATRDVVQAPHAYFDRGTEELALALFLCAPPEHRPRVFATNTAHRYRGREGERRSDGGDHPADVAHNPDHLFQLVTELTARGLPGMRLFQLHGFAERTRRDAFDAVVSAGSRSPTGCVRSVARRLAPLLGEGVRLYPEETRELGGTRNAQARLLQGHPGARFVHLELSPTARRRFSAPERVAHLAAALFVPDED